VLKKGKIMEGRKCASAFATFLPAGNWSNYHTKAFLKNIAQMKKQPL
jgi:hypothetical protein